MEQKSPKQRLIDKIYKLLPIYEGKLLGTTEVVEKDKAYQNFQVNINMVTNQIVGIIRITGHREYLEDVLVSLVGLKSVGIDNHTVVQKTIFKSMKMIEKVGDDNLWQQPLIQ